jgi:hypothetical protein
MSPGENSDEGAGGVLLVLAAELAVLVATLVLPLAMVAAGLRVKGALRVPAGRARSADGIVCQACCWHCLPADAAVITEAGRLTPPR